MAQDTPRPDALTPATLHVLLALGRGPLHGYGVMRQVEEDSGAVVGPGTVYGTLARLEAAGWVEDAGEDRSDPRRGRVFALTRSGRRALEQEVARLHRLAALARERHIVPEEGR